MAPLFCIVKLLEHLVKVYDVECVEVLIHIVLDAVKNDILWVHTYTLKVLVE